jgi:protein TonB
MAYNVNQGAGARWTIGIIFVVALHVAFVIVLNLSFIASAVHEVITVATAVDTPPPPPPDTPPPPPPPPIETPPPFVPPPTIDIATPTTSTNAIQQVTNVAPPPDREAIGTNINKPEYPATSADNCEEGSTKMKLSIDEKGHVVDVQLVTSSGFPALDNAALVAARKWRFSPARTGGKPVASEKVMVLKWELRDSVTKKQYEECQRTRGR